MFLRAVIGGSTPGPLYAALRQTALELAGTEQHQEPPSSQRSTSNSAPSSLDLARVSFFLVDERYVPPTDSKSNVRLVMEELFGQEVCSDPASPGAMTFKPTSAAWPYPNFEFYYPDTSLPLDQCIEKYREVNACNPQVACFTCLFNCMLSPAGSSLVLSPSHKN